MRSVTASFYLVLQARVRVAAPSHRGVPTNEPNRTERHGYSTRKRLSVKR